MERLLERNVQLLIVDPFSETHPAPENDNPEILQVSKMYRSVAQRADCGLIIAHHSRKPQGSSSEGHAGNMDSARGASSLVGVARIILTLDGMSEKDGKSFNIPEEDRNRYVRLDVAKANFSLSHGKPKWYRRNSQTIGRTTNDADGESVGTLVFTELQNNKFGTDSPIFKMLCAAEAVLITQEDNTMPLVKLVEELRASNADYESEKPETIRRRIDRLFADSETLPAKDGALRLIEKDTVGTGKTKTFISWRKND